MCFQTGKSAETRKTSEKKKTFSVWTGLTLLPAAPGGRGGLQAAGFGGAALHGVPALVLAEALLDAVKQPVERHAVYVPLPRTLVLLACNTHTHIQRTRL